MSQKVTEPPRKLQEFCGKCVCVDKNIAPQEVQEGYHGRHAVDI